MNYEQFKKYYEDKNDKEVKKNWSYAEDFTWVDYMYWENKIDFLKEFIKVFNNYPMWDVLVDENIWFIVVWEDMYICKEFLEFCLSNKLKNENAYRFYYHNLENYMDWIKETYEESLIWYLKKAK